jgi:hypothetical protein
MEKLNSFRGMLDLIQTYDSNESKKDLILECIGKYEKAVEQMRLNLAEKVEQELRGLITAEQEIYEELCNATVKVPRLSFDKTTMMITQHL